MRCLPPPPLPPFFFFFFFFFFYFSTLPNALTATEEARTNPPPPQKKKETNKRKKKIPHNSSSIAGYWCVLSPHHYVLTDATNQTKPNQTKPKRGKKKKKKKKKTGQVTISVCTDYTHVCYVPTYRYACIAREGAFHFPSSREIPHDAPGIYMCVYIYIVIHVTAISRQVSGAFKTPRADAPLSHLLFHSMQFFPFSFFFFFFARKIYSMVLRRRTWVVFRVAARWWVGSREGWWAWRNRERRGKGGEGKKKATGIYRSKLLGWSGGGSGGWVDGLFCVRNSSTRNIQVPVLLY